MTTRREPITIDVQFARRFWDAVAKFQDRREAEWRRQALAALQARR